MFPFNWFFISMLHTWTRIENSLKLRIWIGVPLFVAFLFWTFLFVAFNGIVARFLKDYFAIKAHIALNALLAIIITSITTIPIMRSINLWSNKFNNLSKNKRIVLAIATNVFLVLCIYLAN